MSLSDTEDVSVQTGADSSSDSSSSGDSTEDVSVQTGSDSSSSSESYAEAGSKEEVAKRPRYAFKGLVQQTSAGAKNNQK